MPSGTAPSCRISVDHFRARKTGPQFPIAVLTCSTHKLGFTLYPSGHVPYGRERVAPVSPDGAAVRAVTPAGSGGEPAAAPWAPTRFAAVVDAAAGHLWPKEEPGSRLGTQLSRLDDAARLFSVDRGAAAVEEEVARELSLPQLSLRDVADRLEVTLEPTGRGAQLLPLLERLAASARALASALALGARAGLWGAVHFWTRGSKDAAPSRVLFPGVGIPAG